jgi:hypothetical protein
MGTFPECYWMVSGLRLVLSCLWNVPPTGKEKKIIFSFVVAGREHLSIGQEDGRDEHHKVK